MKFKTKTVNQIKLNQYNLHGQVHNLNFFFKTSGVEEKTLKRNYDEIFVAV
jgi:hypothetical protein